MTIFIWLELVVCSLALILIGRWIQEHQDQEDVPEERGRHAAE